MTAKIQTGGFYQLRWKIWEKIRYDALDDNERRRILGVGCSEGQDRCAVKLPTPDLLETVHRAEKKLLVFHSFLLPLDVTQHWMAHHVESQPTSTLNNSVCNFQKPLWILIERFISSCYWFENLWSVDDASLQMFSSTVSVGFLQTKHPKKCVSAWLGRGNTISKQKMTPVSEFT